MKKGRKNKKPTVEEFLESADAKFFMDRLCDILMRQVEEKALERQGKKKNGTQKARRSA